MSAAVSRAIYRQGRAEGDLRECSEEPRQDRARGLISPSCRASLMKAHYVQIFWLWKARVSIPGGWGPRGSLQFPGLLAHAHALSDDCHPPIFIQLLFQWLWEVSGKQQSCLLLLGKLSELQGQALTSRLRVCVCVCACTRTLSHSHGRTQAGAVAPRAPGSLGDALHLPQPA